MFITFEGLDFSGKTTQARLLVDRLAGQQTPDGGSHTVHFIREPGGTEISERIRAILLDRGSHELSDAAELLLFSASRNQLVTRVIKPALERGEVVVCDRFHDSTTAYQGYGRRLNLETVRVINMLATDGVQPDITLFIDIPIEEIERRKTVAGLAFDRMESSGRDFYERVLHGYHELARAEPHRIVRIDGIGGIEEVAAQVWKAIEHILVTPGH
jgi:dTMP kinase